MTSYNHAAARIDASLALFRLTEQVEAARQAHGWIWASHWENLVTVDNDRVKLEYYTHVEGAERVTVYTVGEFIAKPSNVAQFEDFDAAAEYLADCLMAFNAEASHA